MANRKTFADPADPAFARLFGGGGGVPFDDGVAHGDQIAALWLAHGAVVDSLQILYRNGHRTSRHGGLGGIGTWVTFEPGELILGLSGRHGHLVEHLLIRTTHRLIGGGNPLAPGQSFQLDAPDGHHMPGFHGRCGVYLDAIGARLAPLPLPPHAPRDLARAILSHMPDVVFAPLSPEELRSIED